MELKLIVALVLALFILYSTLANIQSIVRPPSANIEGYSGGHEMYVYRRGWKVIKDIRHHDWVWTNNGWRRKYSLRNHHKVWVKSIGWMTYENAKKPVSSADYENLMARMSETEKAAERARMKASEAQSNLDEVKASNANTAEQLNQLVGQ
jgi:hypothetical protein